MPRRVTDPVPRSFWPSAEPSRSGSRRFSAIENGHEHPTVLARSKPRARNATAFQPAGQFPAFGVLQVRRPRGCIHGRRPPPGPAAQIVDAITVPARWPPKFLVEIDPRLLLRNSRSSAASPLRCRLMNRLREASQVLLAVQHGVHFSASRRSVSSEPNAFSRAPRALRTRLSP